MVHENTTTAGHLHGRNRVTPILKMETIVPPKRRLPKVMLDYYTAQLSVPRLRSLVAGLSPRRSGFAPGSIHVGFVVDKVALGQVFLRVLRFPLSIYHSRLISSGEYANVSRHPRLGTRPTPPSGKNIAQKTPVHVYYSCSVAVIAI
jgi:hypothetical protein